MSDDKRPIMDLIQQTIYVLWYQCAEASGFIVEVFREGFQHNRPTGLVPRLHAFALALGIVLLAIALAVNAAVMMIRGSAARTAYA